MQDSSAFAVSHDELTGRRWRYRIPRSRVAFSVLLLLFGVALLASGLALPSLAATIVGALCVLPGAYASFAYYRIYTTGSISGSPATFLEIEEL